MARRSGGMAARGTRTATTIAEECQLTSSLSIQLLIQQSSRSTGPRYAGCVPRDIYAAIRQKGFKLDQGNVAKEIGAATSRHAETVMIIDSRWRHVVALADELALRGRLDADDIRSILEDSARGSPSSALGATNRESAIVRMTLVPRGV